MNLTIGIIIGLILIVYEIKWWKMGMLREENNG